MSQRNMVACKFGCWQLEQKGEGFLGKKAVNDNGVFLKEIPNPKYSFNTLM